jgi:hypothetical protein
VKYSREDHDQRQAEASERREFRFDSGHCRHDQADASEKLTDPAMKTNRFCGTGENHAI